MHSPLEPPFRGFQIIVPILQMTKLMLKDEGIPQWDKVIVMMGRSRLGTEPTALSAKPSSSLSPPFLILYSLPHNGKFAGVAFWQSVHSDKLVS